MPRCNATTSSGKPCRNHAKVNGQVCYSHTSRPKKPPIVRQTYYKFIGKNKGNYPYKLGLNTLADNNEIFDARPRCGPGGLYYTDIDSIFEYLCYGDTLCIVTIPADAQVVQLMGKWKTDRMVIESMHDFWTVETWEMLSTLGVQWREMYFLMAQAIYRQKLELIKFWHENIYPLVSPFIKDSERIVCSNGGNQDISDYFLKLRTEIDSNR